MMTLSIRQPDDMAERLRTIAKQWNSSLNKLMLELSTPILAEEEEAKQCFLADQLHGNPKRYLQSLDELNGLGLWQKKITRMILNGHEFGSIRTAAFYSAS